MEKDRVRAFVLELLEEEYKQDTGEHHNVIIDTMDSLEEDIMLTKPQAEYLQSIMESRVEQAMRNTIRAIDFGRASNPIVTVDGLSIYADAWGTYCRPGTYKAL